MKPCLGHIFINPLDKKKFMGLLCYKNGSLAREEIKNKYNLSWDEFGRILIEENSEDRKIIQLNFPLPEITPSNKQGKWIYEIDAAGVLKNFEGELTMREDIVSFITGQILAKRCHVEKFGFKSTKRLIVTGGASKNRELIQVISDIFQVGSLFSALDLIFRWTFSINPKQSIPLLSVLHTEPIIQLEIHHKATKKQLQRLEIWKNWRHRTIQKQNITSKSSSQKFLAYYQF